MLPKPIEIRRGRLENLPPHYLESWSNASDVLTINGDEEIRIETYHTQDICQLFAGVWGWEMSLAGLDSREAQRVRSIIDKIQRGEPWWPYVSYWASDMEELAETYTETTGEVVVPNHGDGWHRVIAAVELGLPTVEITFLECSS